MSIGYRRWNGSPMMMSSPVYVPKEEGEGGVVEAESDAMRDCPRVGVRKVRHRVELRPVDHPGARVAGDAFDVDRPVGDLLFRPQEVRHLRDCENKQENQKYLARRTVAAAKLTFRIGQDR